MGLPTFNAGTVPTAADWQTLLPIRVKKTVDQTIASSATLTNDTALVSPTLVSGAEYEVNTLLIYTAGAAASVNGIKFGWTAPASSTLDWVPYSKIDTDGTSTNSPLWIIYRSLTDTIFSGGAGTAACCAHIYGYLTVGTAGVLQFQWAQNTSNATGTVVKANSRMTLRRTA